ncbi:MAG: 16S rRNA (cytidine(1402)-2'-O)-methyltransferase [Patescibacteria group bacterium]
MTGKLSIVATPIGNLKDLTFRAEETLRMCDVIVCEDTRVTSKLLAAYKISKPLRALHERSDDAALRPILKDLEEGKHVVYVSDAGTPGVNDPGGKLVEIAIEHGITVEPIPGASALSAAISVCGFPMSEFVYLGFVPQKKGRQTFFAEIAGRKTPSVFFESTHRILKTLESLRTTLDPARLVFIGRELTKMHETLYRGTAQDVETAIQQTSTKGEFVIIVGPQGKR